jgi:hypothetical protein
VEGFLFLDELVRTRRRGKNEAARLLSDLTASLADKTLPARLRYYARPDFLIIDEFGLGRIERTVRRRPTYSTRSSPHAVRSAPPRW